VLRIGDLELNVAVLEDKTRIVTHSDVFKSLGRTPRGNARLIGIPAFMDDCIFLINALRSLFIKGCRFFASIKAGIPINLALPLGVLPKDLKTSECVTILVLLGVICE
jgi:hypothetical protein